MLRANPYSIIVEELQARLTEQRDGVMEVNKDSNSHQASVIDNDDYSSEEGNETRDIPSFSTAETSQNLGEVQCWPALYGIEPPSEPSRNQLYFDRVHTFAPILQKSRYLSWSKQLGKTKQKLCLQYAMWILAASFSSQFQALRSNLYNEARHLLDTLDTDTEISQATPHLIHIEQVQAWVLMAMYELTSDTSNYQHDYDWVDKESMRRTFWLAYTIDRFTSSIDDVPLTFNEQQIRTRLPSPEAQFTSGKPIEMCFLFEALNAVENGHFRKNNSPFIQSVIIATICGRVLEHKRRPPTAHPRSQDPGSVDPNRDSMYEFCHRQRSLNTILTRHTKLLSTQVPQDTEQPDPILVFVTLKAYMAILILCETLEPANSGIEAHSTQMIDALLFEQNQRALDAARELAMLTTRLGNIDHFQVGNSRFTLAPFQSYLFPMSRKSVP
ncbi:hypothetical protein EKO27_g6371 [Xylaria grammica]|uniref:Xylanolytic transcriptional activator regulatory domain-containing protein n=1 Tax=Xylaria grammica TaxID=363999 RepID=A0A439D3A6_9PEZI|nr:hypothetical protein EKO27_g6371 [Xylaria grammica]